MKVREHHLGGYRAIDLESQAIRVTVLPDKGAEIYALIDLVSGVDLLFKTAWGLRRPGPGVHIPTSEGAWMELYGGGWQILIPNAGDANAGPAGSFGFHGEASIVPWTLVSIGQSELVLEVWLQTAPLHVVRSISVNAGTVAVHERITNYSPDPTAFEWVHHPAFGAPFIDARASLHLDANEFVADDVSPGADLVPGSVHRWPIVVGRTGERIDLSRAPAPHDRRAILGYLRGWQHGVYRIASPSTGIAFELSWPRAVFPDAWFWQEVHESSGQPWFRSAYVMAIEPASTIPGHGLADAISRQARTITLQPGGVVASAVRGRVLRERP